MVKKRKFLYAVVFTSGSNLYTWIDLGETYEKHIYKNVKRKSSEKKTPTESNTVLFCVLVVFEVSRNESKISDSVFGLLALSLCLSRTYIFFCTKIPHLNETALQNKLQPEPNALTSSLHVQGRPLHTFPPTINYQNF